MEQESSRLWVIQQCQGSENVTHPNTVKVWKQLFAFTEAEALHEDHENSAFITSYYPRPNVVREQVVCVLYFVTDDTKHLPIEEAMLGKYIMYKGALTRYIGPKTEVVETFKSEKDRIDALKEYFNIHLPLSSIQNIGGRTSAIPIHTASSTHER